MRNVNKMRGDGSFYERDGKIYVCGSVDGVFYKKSTGKKYSVQEMKRLENSAQTPAEYLADMMNKKVVKKPYLYDIKNYGEMIIEKESANRSKEVQTDYKLCLNRYIVPYFSQYSLEDVLPLHIEEWQNKVISHLSYDRQKRIKGVLREIFRNAKKNRMISYNPVLESDHLKKRVTERVVVETYTNEEIKKILQESFKEKDNNWIYMWFLLSFTTGLRVGELLGLKWDDIDFDEGILFLRRSRTKGVENKTNSRKNHDRDIILLRNVADELRLMKMRSESEYIFVSSNTFKPFYESKSIVDYVEPFLNSIDIKYKKLKTTRASFITLMNKNKVDFDLVQKTVGHSKNSSTTIRNYHDDRLTIDEMREKMVNVENIFIDLSN